MVVRIWHGWTEREKADEYENLLTHSIFPEIRAKGVTGYIGIELLRREAAGEVEFITLMRFESVTAVKEFAGEDYEAAYVPQSARMLLSRFDQRSKHYQVSRTAREFAGLDYVAS